MKYHDKRSSSANLFLPDLLYMLKVILIQVTHSLVGDLLVTSFLFVMN